MTPCEQRVTWLDGERSWEGDPLGILDCFLRKQEDLVGVFIEVFCRILRNFLVVSDVGCCQKIIDGKVKVRGGVNVATIEENQVILTDGAKLDADVIVFA